MQPQIRRILSVVTAVLLALLVPAAGLGGAAAAGKGRPVIKVQDAPTEGFFYGDFDADLMALVGAPLDADSCQGAGFPTVTKVFRERRDGSWTERWRDRQSVTIYSTPLAPPDFIAEMCPGIIEGGPAPEPFATGRGQVRSLVAGLDSPEGPPLPGARIVNRTFGFVEDADGQRYRVRAKADLVLDEDLNPIGDPADFQWLSVKPVG